MPAMPTFPKNRCLLYFCYFPMWYPGSGVILDFLAHQFGISVVFTHFEIFLSHIPMHTRSSDPYVSSLSDKICPTSLPM